MKIKRYILMTATLAVFTAIGCSGQTAPKTQQAQRQAEIIPASTEKKMFYGFSVNIPTGWQLFQSGSCSELSFISWDPNHQERQFFYYGTAGICYMSFQQKQVDDNYVRMGGMRSPLIGSPVISPFTPENFVMNYHLFAERNQGGQYGQKTPEMYNVQIISVNRQPAGMPYPASAAMIRAIYTNRNKTMVSEGLFLVTVMPYQLTAYGPGSSLGVIYSFMGITAALGQLDNSLTPLSNCISSLTIDQNYVNNCMQNANRATQTVLEQGKMLSQSSDNMIKGWQARSRTDDIISQKRSDAILGRERLYDPVTKQVYNVDNTFTDKYLTDPQKYNLPNLQRLPANDYNLWNQPTMNGAEHIVRNY